MNNETHNNTAVIMRDLEALNRFTTKRYERVEQLVQIFQANREQ